MATAVWQEAKRYFDLAGRLIAPKPPLLVAIGGLSGTGKSVLARGLAGLIEPPPGAVIVRSDVVRKHLFGVSETTALPEAAYRADVTERVYGMLSSTARRVLAQGCSVVLDAALPAGSGTDGNRTVLAAHARHSLRRPVPHCGSRDAAGADRAAQGRCVRCNAECRTKRRLGEGRRRTGTRMDTASGTPDQSASQRPFVFLWSA